ncbi:MAG: outer membrane protein assembly factor BamA [Verrucomicrobia bacterium]|nr:outer membrane protein assembly factor BamA [Verrucomicrobiota bacterium]NMD21085.1 outer membrane protein assembly factor BamA [Verrucomicrobiota bacterium]HNV00216.1 outer membrane protein assembly factor BamA [Verrucomicrobiota bacterium]HOA62197.1 outer membrane protein assembly factor BamA [Verrucomicrobiota bacterium]HOF49601.1 outer membrane protein assembly factor BamA [Verrucomicrobiota bacterium]
MRCRPRLSLALGAAVLLVANNLALQAQEAPRVSSIEIKHVGPPAASDGLIRAQIRVKEGDTYKPGSVADDVNSLWRTGYFYNIRVIEEPSDAGLKLIYLVQGNPTLTQINFNGNRRLSEGKLRKKLTSKVGEPLNERKLFADTQEILKRYQKAGLQKTEVKYVPVIDEALGKGTVTFEIVEAPKVKIDDVVFVGAQGFKQSKLRRVIKTRRHWMFSWLTGSGVFKDEQFEDDKDRLAEFYRNEGYIDFQIREVKFEETNPKRMLIRIYTDEGARYQVGSVDFQGNKLFTASDIQTRAVTREGNKVRRGLSMGPGEVFTPRGLSKDREAVQDFYGSRGYIDAQVSPARVPNTAAGAIDLTYKIDEGRKSYVEKIDIKGNTRTKDRVIRRELAVHPGEVFDMVSVRLSTNRLYGLNYFAKIDAQPEPTEVPDRKNLVIAVEEKNTGDFRVGAGFSSVDELVGFVEVSQGNFDLFKWPYFLGTGAGQKLRARVQMGTRRKDFLLTFIEPWFLNRKLALSTDFYHRELSYYSDLYDTVLSGVRVGLTRTLWNDFWLGSIGYEIQNVGIVDMPREPEDPDRDRVPQEIRAEEGYTLVSKIFGSIAYDTRNSVLLPNRGQRTALESEIAGGPLGGDTDFYKLQLRSARYIRGLAPGHVLELSGRIGVVDNYGSDDLVHLFDRFFLGGMYTLRGYRFREVGPYDSRGREPIGGRTYWFGSAEYSIPLIERLRLAVFYDIGNVYPLSYSFDTLPDNYGPHPYGAYSDNWGVGIRFNIPMLGPLRLDYAWPLTHDNYTGDSGRFQFGVGFTREDY